MSDVTDNGQPDETQNEEENPVCPDCGERHPTMPTAIKAILEATWRIQEALVPMTRHMRIAVYGRLLSQEMAESDPQEKLRVLTILAGELGITILVAPTETETDVGPSYVDLSRWTPKGSAN